MDENVGKIASRFFVVFSFVFILMFVPPNQGFADSAEDTLTFQLLYVTGNKACYHNENQKMNEYYDFTKKYISMYGVRAYSYGPSCLTVSEYENYQAPDLTDLLIVVYHKNTGRDTLQAHDIGGYFTWGTNENTNGLRIETCDCDGFYKFNEPFWVLSHELSHFVLYYLGFDKDIFVDWVHNVQTKYYAYCGTQGDTSYANCSGLYTKISGYSRDYKVMAFNSDAYGKTPPQAKFINSAQKTEKQLFFDSTDEFKKLTIHGSNSAIFYKILEGNVISVNPDFDAKSLILQIFSESDGLLQVALPRWVIESANNYGDDNYFVLVDGKEVEFNERTDDNYRYLTMSFPSGVDKIEIIGTKLLLELESESTQEKSNFKAYADEIQKNTENEKTLGEAYQKIASTERQLTQLWDRILIQDQIINDLNPHSEQGKQKLGDIWKVFLNTKTKIHEVQSILNSGNSYYNNGQYDAALKKLSSIDVILPTVIPDLDWVSKAIEDVKNMEKENMDLVVLKDGKVCVLSWCI